MNLTQLLILQFTAHLLSDYLLQPGKQALEKNELGFKSQFLKWHILITFLVSWLLSFQLNFVFAALAIAILHWLTDGFKRIINTHPQLGKHAFFIDQALHLIVITVVVLLFNRYFELDPLFGIPVKAKYLLIVAGYIFCAKPANIFIKGIFNAFEVQTTNTGNVDLPNAGKLIGIIERFLVLTFIILNQFQAVGFLIAAKSILRFKDDLKAEYVLIGTMLSFALAIGMGILINQF